MEKIIGITKEKRDYILNKISETEKLLNESIDILISINKENVFDGRINPLRKIREGINGLSQAMSDINSLESDMEAKEKIRLLEVWFNSPKNDINSLKGKSFNECWQMLIL